MNNKDISNQIQILLNQFNAGNFDLVISKSKVLLKKNPEYAILYNLLGSAYQNIADYVKAQQSFKKGLQLDPNNIALMNNLAMAHKNLLEYKTAEELYLKILKINNKYINAYINYGNLKRDINKFSESIELYEKALEIKKDSPIIYYSLALAHQGIGNFDKAIYYSKESLKLNPKFSRADHLISQSTKYKEHDEHYLSLKKKLDLFDTKSFEKVDLYFSLAKAEEDMDNINESVAYLKKGNNLKKELLKYNVSDELNLFKNLKENFNKLENNTSNDDKNYKIIFILGMPRSGTSLVEQIITSHSQVYGGGELPILSNIVKDNFIEGNDSIKDDFYEIIKDPLKITELRTKYFNFIKSFDYNQDYITDKAPLNFRWIGFIRILFPNSKIVHCERDAKNNCLSIYKNLFEGGLNFSYDEEDIVKYYTYYSDLINFWKSKYPKLIYNARYENLVSNNVEEIKKIIKFCDLEWEESCLTFHKNKTPIKTMSTAQARRPIYKSSLNSFEKYKDYLKVLEKKL
jgi:tetratricopeptide (TPR) repeat protein